MPVASVEEPIEVIRAETRAATGFGSDAPRLEELALTPPQARIVAAAYDLFAEHGVSGTSLVMIAERIGVTKAAVYHQFKTKEEILLAATTRELVTIERTLDAAEADPDPIGAREDVLETVVDFLIARRGRALLIQNDPMMHRLLWDYEPFNALMRRLFRILTGEDTPGSRVRGAMMGAAIDAAMMHPLALELDDEELRAELLAFARGALGIPPARSVGPTMPSSESS